jgi:hypothetical protein
MKTIVAGLGALFATVSIAGLGLAQEAPGPPSSVAPEQVAPPQNQWVYSYPTGQWVYTAENGWIWIPAGATPTEVDGVPYTYLYTPVHGWNWYVSPWGWGGYHYGPWVAHPWRPYGWRGGWVAQPHVVVRLGAGHYGGHYGGWGHYGGGYHYGHRR